MLPLTGHQADRWLPTKMTALDDGNALTTIQQSARDAGRDPDRITPGLLGYVLMGPDAEGVRRVTEAPLVRVTTWYDTRDVRRQVVDRAVDSSSAQRREEAG
jgi:alkanesulfonate monooxygenase SsuD/methylene tetrahydromethanopterin reductase-like flavin-dependent oxidoreductase (luciferase family)